MKTGHLKTGNLKTGKASASIFCAVLFGSFAALLVANCGIMETADCCECLIRHNPDGMELVDKSEEELMGQNCLPIAESPDEQGSICGNTLGPMVGGAPDAEKLRVKANSCVEDVCKDQCKDLANMEYETARSE